MHCNIDHDELMAYTGNVNKTDDTRNGSGRAHEWLVNAVEAYDEAAGVRLYPEGDPEDAVEGV